MNKIILISSLLSILFLNLNAQWNVDEKRSNKWYFSATGNLNIMDFSQANSIQLPSIDTSITQPMTSDYNRSSICDTNGNLLFYSNGIHIYDSTFQLLQNGHYITPNYNSGSCFADGVIFLPMPKHDSLYYVFTVSNDTPCVTLGGQYLYYSIINSKLNNGKGAVISKSNLLFSGDLLSAGLLKACRHGNGEDWWLLIKDSKGNKYYRFLLDSSGIHSFQAQQIGVPYFVGDTWQVAFCPKGNKYAIVSSHGTFDHDTTDLNIFDFDRCTGLLSNPIQYTQFRVDTFLNDFGICFSPNGQYLYWSNLDSIFQYDLSTNLSTNVAVFDSSLVPTWGIPFMSYFKFAYMQLGPDGRIYVGTGINYLNYIDNPDIAGIACDVHKLEIMLPYTPAFFLLNMPFYKIPPISCDTVVGMPAEQFLNDKVSIYPNPGSGEFTLDITKVNCNIEVYSISGELVFNQSNASLRSVINLANQANGLYLVRVMFEGSLLDEQKILKE